ncbi:MAG: O-antigen ligase family protein [Clostridia bacterium]|nr:O-antigen ligase family protein [Clostridia bacterium]
MEIDIKYPNFKNLNEKINKFKFTSNTLATILIIAIMVVIPMLFLPYIYEKTNQLLLTYYFTGITLIGFLILKIYNHVKNVEKITFKLKIKLDLVDIAFIIYAILIMASALLSEWFPHTLITGTIARHEGALTLYLYIVLFYIAYKVFKFDTKYLPYMAASTMLISAIGIVQAIIFYPTALHKYMAFGSFGNPNFFSTYLSMFLPIYIIVYLVKGNKFYLLTSIITFAALVCTKTLGGYITFLIYLIIILIYAISQKVDFKRIGILLLAFSLAFILLNICTNNTYLKEFVSLEKEQTNLTENTDRFGSGRGLIYKLGLEIVSLNPWLGIGPDSLGAEILYKYYYQPRYTSELLFDKAHCEYLQIAICTGIPSLICYIIAIGTIGIKLFIKFLKNKKDITVFAIGISLLSYLIQAFTNISVTHVAPMFWIILGIGYSLCKDTSLENK